MEKIQRKIALRFISDYHPVSVKSLYVLASILPIELIVYYVMRNLLYLFIN